MGRNCQWILVSSLLMCAISGCGPAVTWLPDGAGFVYTEKEGRQLVVYSLQKHAKRVVVADTGTRTDLPAVSPDGTMCAVGLATCEKDRPVTLQVFVYRLDGSLFRKTGVHELGKPAIEPPDKLAPTALAWGKQNSVVVWVPPAQSTVIVDLDRDRINQLPGAMPIPTEGWSPVRPDRKGFLVANGIGDEAKGEMAFSLVDWDGWEKRLGSPGKYDPLSRIEARWEGKTACFGSADSMLRIDTEGRSVALSRQIFAHLPSTGKIYECHSFPGATSKLCCFVLPKPETDLFFTGFLVEFQDPKTGRRKVIIPRCAQVTLAASPDRKLVAVRTEDQIIVVDSAGTIIGQVALDGG